MELIIKFQDKAKADELKALGFNYMTEKVNNETTLYAFEYNNEIAQLLISKFDAKDYFFSNKLLF